MSPNPDVGKRPGSTRTHEPRSFETAYRELQAIVEQLETGDPGGLDLEHAISLFARGTELAQQCERIVAAAELRVTRLAAEEPTALGDD